MAAVLFITVNYQCAAATETFLKAAAELECASQATILVVENASGDGSAEKIRPLAGKFKNVELLESSHNRGYFGAANWALQQHLACGNQPTWVIVCNNDVIFADHQFLAKLLQRDPADAQVVAPAIIPEATGVDCNPFLRRRPSPFALWRFRFWNSHYYFMWSKQFLSPYVRIARHKLAFWRRLFGRWSSTTKGRSLIYAPHGAFLIFSRSYFEAGGYIDDGFFLYAEELSVAEICRRLKLRIVHDPELRVLHDAHQVTGRMCNRTTYEYGRQGLDYALRTYFSPETANASQPND
jgi:GT2 family glycosyltransferase